MRVLRVRLRDFRSYERAEADLGEGLTVVLVRGGEQGTLSPQMARFVAA